MTKVENVFVYPLKAEHVRSLFEFFFFDTYISPVMDFLEARDKWEHYVGKSFTLWYKKNIRELWSYGNVNDIVCTSMYG